MKNLLKISLFLTTMGALLLSIFAYSEEKVEPKLPIEEMTQTATYAQIDAAGLKDLIDTNANFTLLDARGANAYDGKLIPGAQLASVSDSDEDLSKLIFDKSDLVVVYSSGSDSAADELAAKLTALHYQNVVVYSAGLTDWADIHNFPVETTV